MKVTYLIFALVLCIMISPAYATSDILNKDTKYFEAKLTYDDSIPAVATITCKVIKNISANYWVQLVVYVDNPTITKWQLTSTPTLSYDLKSDYDKDKIYGSCDAIHKTDTSKNHLEAFEIVIRDTDNDGINDTRDQCPHSSEAYNGLKDEDGCTDDIENHYNNLKDSYLTLVVSKTKVYPGDTITIECEEHLPADEKITGPNERPIGTEIDVRIDAKNQLGGAEAVKKKINYQIPRDVTVNSEINVYCMVSFSSKYNNEGVGLRKGQVVTVLQSTPVNTKPLIDTITDVTINEDTPTLTVTLTGISDGGDGNQNLTVTSTSNNTALIPDPTVTYNTPDTTGSLLYTLVDDAHGVAEITVTVSDGIDTVTETFTITVTPVNDTTTDKLNRNITYFESNITYDQTVIPWQATVSCKIIEPIPDTYEAQMTISGSQNGGGPYLTDSNNLTFILPPVNYDQFKGACKVVKITAGATPKYEPFTLLIEDYDKDGVVNLVDLCPSLQEDRIGINGKERDGCPDTTAPDKPIIIKRDKLYIHGTSELDSIVSLHLDGKYIGETKSDGKWVIPLSLSKGTYTVVAYATDAAGNKSEKTTKQYTIIERNKPDSSGEKQPITDTGSNANNNNSAYIVTPKVTPENVKPGDTFTATCEENHSDPNYIWHVALHDDYPVTMETIFKQGMINKPLVYTISSNHPTNEIVVACWYSFMHGDSSHTSRPNSVILTWTVVETNTDVETDTQKKKKSNGACADCTPPTLGSTKNFDRVVEDGFSYNGQTVKVEKWYTEFPLINATVGVPNLVEIKVFENTGITNMKWVQFCLGAEERGQPLNSCEVLIEVHLQTYGTLTDIDVQEIVITDKENLIDNDTVTASTYVTECMDESPTQECVKVDLEYTYREETFNHMLIVNVADKARNSQNFHFNEGVNVLGESVNESPTITLSNKHASQQKDNLYITYTRTDKITDTWVDQYGIEYHRINDVTFDRITAPESHQCNDPPLDEINVPTRKNCNFRALTSLWDY